MKRSLRRLIRRMGFSEVVLGDPHLVKRLDGLGRQLRGQLRDYVERVIPSSSLDLGEMMILGSEAFLDANTLQDPGSRVSGLGFWTLATLSGGDIYLYDQAEERVRMVDPCQLHSLLGKAGVALTRSSVEALVLDPGEELEEFMESLVDLYAS
ncbi:hypothetical protein [Verrucomicrobium spinosum]|uniref:hypothetical protein n=1 Tax=Verrucomicrobium spinosum TaxID=2736 RepID=UPI0001745BAD|nr:hypothetical protein [Verrucomicrobium spinosum]